MYINSNRIVVVVYSIIYSIGLAIFKRVVYALLGHTGHHVRYQTNLRIKNIYLRDVLFNLALNGGSKKVLMCDLE